jgi:hypothetical protein
MLTLSMNENRPNLTTGAAQVHRAYVQTDRAQQDWRSKQVTSREGLWFARAGNNAEEEIVDKKKHGIAEVSFVQKTKAKNTRRKNVQQPVKMRCGVLGRAVPPIEHHRLRLWIY